MKFCANGYSISHTVILKVQQWKEVDQSSLQNH